MKPYHIIFHYIICFIGKMTWNFVYNVENGKIASTIINSNLWPSAAWGRNCMNALRLGTSSVASQPGFNIHPCTSEWGCATLVPGSNSLDHVERRNSQAKLFVLKNHLNFTHRRLFFIPHNKFYNYLDK